MELISFMSCALMCVSELLKCMLSWIEQSHFLLSWEKVVILGHAGHISKLFLTKLSAFVV